MQPDKDIPSTELRRSKRGHDANVVVLSWRRPGDRPALDDRDRAVVRRCNTILKVCCSSERSSETAQTSHPASRSTGSAYVSQIDVEVQIAPAIKLASLHSRAHEPCHRRFGKTANQFVLQVQVATSRIDGRIAFHACAPSERSKQGGSRRSCRRLTTPQARAPWSATEAPTECLALDRCRRSASARPGRAPVVGDPR